MEDLSPSQQEAKDPSAIKLGIIPYIQFIRI